MFLTTRVLASYYSRGAAAKVRRIDCSTPTRETISSEVRREGITPSSVVTAVAQGKRHFFPPHARLNLVFCRTRTQDHPDEASKRHLLRLWLSTPNGWDLPPQFAERYGNIERGTLRGGIRVPGQKLVAPLEAL
eukprot:9493646-Pyramimonas_sp.AAC.2